MQALPQTMTDQVQNGAFQIAVCVINLARRPERLAHIAKQLNAIGVDWRLFPAHDMLTVDRKMLANKVSAHDHVRTMGLGSQCCALTNLDIFSWMVAEDVPAALVVQDDAELSPDIKSFLATLDWLPDDAHIVQFEKSGRHSSTRLLGPAIGQMPVPGRRLHRLFSRTGGAACYLITRAGAAAILAQDTTVKMPIDHLLFSPNLSPVFGDLGVCIVNPGLARQMDDTFESDLTGERAQRRKNPKEKLRRLWQDINRVPQQLVAMARGARWLPFDYMK